jgi:hypothetical protein
MSKGERTVVYDGGQLFRVEHQVIDGRRLPYEFVRRVGATTVLPITTMDDKPHVIGIRNTRAFYGTSMGLPGGNADGGFENPEHPGRVGVRELGEEAGYGYPAGATPNIDTFLLRPVSNSILYDRSFSVARDVTYVGGEHANPNEVVEVVAAPLDEYMEPIFALRQGDLYPELSLAFARARQEVGHDQVIDWLSRGGDSPHASDVVESFGPWMTLVEPPETYY